jgi:hypothetical protein
MRAGCRPLPGRSTSPRATAALVLVALVALGGSAVWHAAGRSGGTSLAWRDRSEALAGIHLRRPAFEPFKVPEAVTDFQRDQGIFPQRPVAADYRMRELVLISPGPRSSTGYDVRVVRVVEQRAQIKLEVREVSPRLGRRVEPRVTSPFRLIEIPRSAKPISIRWVGP